MVVMSLITGLQFEKRPIVIRMRAPTSKSFVKREREEEWMLDGASDAASAGLRPRAILWRECVHYN